MPFEIGSAAQEMSVQAESQQLALAYMKQKSLTDDSPADIAREYRMVQQQIKAALESM